MSFVSERIHFQNGYSERLFVFEYGDANNTPNSFFDFTLVAISSVSNLTLEKTSFDCRQPESRPDSSGQKPVVYNADQQNGQRSHDESPGIQVGRFGGREVGRFPDRPFFSAILFDHSGVRHECCNKSQALSDRNCHS